MTMPARMLTLGLLAALALAPAAPAALPERAAAPKVVYLAGGLSDEALIAFGAAVASRPDALLLLDSPEQSAFLKHFLAELKPERLVAVGSFRESRDALSRRLGVKVEAVREWDESVWPKLFGRIDRVVLCPAEPRSLLLEAACLAGAEGVPLLVAPRPASLRRRLGEWKTKQIVAVGGIAVPKIDGCEVSKLPRAADVRAAHLRKLGKGVTRAVVTNPDDLGKGSGGMSALAPWLAVQKDAALLMTGPKGTDVPEVVKEASKRAALARLETVILLGNLRSIPTRQRPNPIPDDKDKAIDMEPLTPATGAPFSYAVGRLFHEDRAVVPLMLARQRLMATRAGPRKALVASNPGGSLPLLEMFSRNTARELRNAGWDVEAIYNKQVTAEALREKMVGPDLFLWEGHHNTLVKEWGFTKWDEPLPPTFVVLQSCLALMPEKVEPLLARGAVGVVGTSTRTYSGSGGAFSLSFLSGCVYEGREAGDSLRQAKNFLVCYAALKQKRLGDQATRVGANHRAAWAFTLWGDPTFQLPRPPRPDSALPIVRHEVKGSTIVVDIPAELHGKVVTTKYQVKMAANARLAGLLRKDDDVAQPLVPFLFAEVHLPKARPGLTPRLRSRLPSSQWVFVWDERRRTGYLLTLAPRREGGELRFRVDWPGPSVAAKDEG